MIKWIITICYVSKCKLLLFANIITSIISKCYYRPPVRSAGDLLVFGYTALYGVAIAIACSMIAIC